MRQGIARCAPWRERRGYHGSEAVERRPGRVAVEHRREVHAAREAREHSAGLLRARSRGVPPDRERKDGRRRRVEDAARAARAVGARGLRRHARLPHHSLGTLPARWRCSAAQHRRRNSVDKARLLCLLPARHAAHSELKGVGDGAVAVAREGRQALLQGRQHVPQRRRRITRLARPIARRHNRSERRPTLPNPDGLVLRTL